MENKKQDQQQRASTDGAAKRISATYSEPTPPSEHFDLDLDHNTDPKDEPQKPGWRKFLAHVGPGFLVSLAYLDPGNLETDLQAGANHRYELLWVILIGLIFALIIQSLSANLGVTTGKHLSELCKAEYPPFVKYCLWLLAEVAVIAADIPEVIGTAFALNILFNIPVWAGVLLTGFSTLLLLGLQKYGVRKLEMLIAVLVFVMAACFFGEMSYVKPPASGVLKGMFIPKLSGQGATGDAIALLGALVMPHNLFLHSALVLSRKIPKSVRGINDACRYFLIESGFALFVAFLINVAIVSVSGTVCHQSNLSDKDNDTCSDLTLNSASFLLQALGPALVHEPGARACWGALASQRWSRSLGHLGPMLSTIPRAIAPGGAALMNVLGRSSKILYAIALLASGQSSTITGTYAGQFVMQGFLNIKMKKWARNLMTRCIAITPSLIVSIIGGSSGAGRLIIVASMILSFELPFALIPLLKFSGSATKMGPHKNSIYIIVISWILGMGIIGINIYYLSTGFVGWIIHSSLPKVATVFIGILVFPFMAIYILAVLYLTLRKDSVVTFVEPTMNDPAAQNQMENGLPNYGEPPVPFREDLADIPLPQ